MLNGFWVSIGNGPECSIFIHFVSIDIICQIICQNIDGLLLEADDL